MHANAFLLQLLRNLVRVIDDLFAHWTDFHLHRRQPQWKRSGVMFDQNAEETFHRTKQRAMHHQRLMPRPVIGDIFELEACREIEIKLHRPELPWPADRID